MTNWLIRRVLYALPILLGVNLITFMLFFMVNSPDQMARMQLGGKRVSTEAIEKWKEDRGYDLPFFVNAEKNGIETLTQTIFFNKSMRLFIGDFGRAEDGRNIAREIKSRAIPSLAIALPSFVLGLFAAICVALLLAFYKETRADFIGLSACVFFMSISELFYNLCFNIM